MFLMAYNVRRTVAEPGAVIDTAVLAVAH